MMKDLINDLNKAIADSVPQEIVVDYIKAKITKNINEAVCVPEFYDLGFELLNEIFDKSDAIDSRNIPTVVSSVYKFFGDKACELLMHIKCGKLSELVNGIGVEAEKEVYCILDAMEFIPIIREVKKTIQDVISGYRTALKERVCISEDEISSFDIDWEGEYKTIKEKYELIEQKMSIIKQLRNSPKVKERIIEGEEREKIERVIEGRDVKELIEVISKDLSLLYGDILHMCAECGWKEGVDVILEICFLEDDYVNKNNINGDASLILASLEGHLEVVKYLISKGANIEAKNNYEETSLTLASWKGHLEVVKYLISKGANIEVKNINGITALILASWKGHFEIVKYLISKGANIEAKNINEDTSLILASWKDHLEVVNYLISKGANIESKNINGATALTLASEEGHLEVVNYLISKGANIESKSINEDTSLILASWKGHLEVVNYLISKGANIEAKNINQDTSLTLASREGHIKVVNYLNSIH